MSLANIFVVVVPVHEQPDSVEGHVDLPDGIDSLLENISKSAQPRNRAASAKEYPVQQEGRYVRLKVFAR